MFRHDRCYVTQAETQTAWEVIWGRIILKAIRMTSISVHQMELVKGGDLHTYCGIAVGIAMFAPNPFSIAGAMIVCLSGDTRKK